MRQSLFIKISVFLLFVFSIMFLISCSNNKIEEKKLKTVNFGMLPYADHTYAIIGVKKNWFEDVGINLVYKDIKVEEIIPSLRNKTLDVVSTPPGILFASYDNANDLCSFVFGDLFQGYALMAQPNKGYVTYNEFIKNGLSPESAIKATVKQISGKTFAYPTEAAIKPFIDLLLSKGDIKRDEFKSLVLDDPLTVNAMRNNQADFQVGGVPSRITLQSEGFVPLISSIDLAKLAEPSPESKELASILQNGWATRKVYFDNNLPTILRLASVNYRIMRFINDSSTAALELHLPYLNKITGQNFTIQQGEIIYKDLNPFVTFENQYGWFYNNNNPLYYKNVNGAILNNFVSQGIYKNDPPSVNDVIYANIVYSKLLKYKNEADSLYSIIKQNNFLDKKEIYKNLFNHSNNYYRIYNFYDAAQLVDSLKQTAIKNNDWNN